MSLNLPPALVEAVLLQRVSGVWVMLSGGAVVVLAQRGLALSPHWAATVPYADVI